MHIDTPDGPYSLEADWLIACDGARSPTRAMLNLSFDGRVFEDNSGRLSVPCVYDNLPLNGPDELDGPLATRVGAPCTDVDLGDSHLLNELGNHFTLLCINCSVPEEIIDEDIQVATLSLHTDATSASQLATRYLGEHATAVYLIRPDQHVVARWKTASVEQIRDALQIAIGKG